ncbi:MAG: glycosyltransferase family 9 protein [Phycisphaerales bacterium]
MPSRTDGPARILIVRPSALGDVCRTVPVAASLRARWPGATIGWVVQKGFEDAIAAHPAVDEVIAFPRRDFRQPWRPAVAAAINRWRRDLRGGAWDLVIDAQGLGRSGLIALASGARVRIGEAGAREAAWMMYTRRVPIREPRHAVDRMLDLVAAAGAEPVEAMDLAVPAAATDWWKGVRREAGLGDRPYAVIAPTARWRSKQWPADRFAAVADHVAGRGLACVFVGAPGEEDAVRAAIPAQSGAADRRDHLDLSGRTTVGGMMAVIAGASLIVTGDSAPLHMAAGLQTPAVALFGPTEPDRVGPRGDGPLTVLGGVDPQRDGVVNYRRLRDDDRWMQRIEVETVKRAVDELRDRSAIPTDVSAVSGVSDESEVSGVPGVPGVNAS